MKKIVILAFIVNSICFANETVEYTESKNGLTHPFFGYKEEIIKEENKDEVKKTVDIPTNLDKMTADEIAKLIEDSKKTAVSFPTDENIHNYIQLQNYATKKSENFAIKWQQAILKDSSLDLSATAAKSTFARNASTADKTTKRAQFWKENIDKIGIVAFFDKKENEVNTAQNKVLYFLNQDYPNLAIRTIFKDEHSPLVEKYKVGVTPDIFIVYKDEDENANWYRLKAGLTTKNEILDNIDFVYEYFISKGNKK
ncbi:conjugal transfer protein TraF [Aliarcobacter butzleri]|uniref:conjugal transfer protein TraF n=1 Tax=Aliarcobacter butzleri TaxID=28197 RepID=UPI002B247860|nr:conjugal transfer protein TraF [Aliarcobacter butzleri]